MAPFAGPLGTLSALAVVCLVGRAVAKLLDDSRSGHDALVSTRERRATTAAGVPLTLVGLSTMTGGPLAAPVDPLTFLFPGVALLAYPDFTPSAL